jgi:inositol 1,4,5-triphosphate receptor type 1
MKRGSTFNTSASESVEVQTPLKIGDQILLFSQEGQGYVYCEVSSNVIQSVCVYPLGSNPQNEPDLPNIHCACFKVLASNKYKAQERLAQLKIGLKGKTLTDNDRKQLKVAERNAKGEQEDNEADQNRSLGQPVLYGHQIQLQHMYTKKYLAANSLQTSPLESTNIRTAMISENSPSCIFKILPRYRIRSIGDEVRISDQVIFESVKTEGQYLHSSLRALGEIGQHLNGFCKELNLSANESAFTIVAHYPATKAVQQADLVKAGSIIRLFHREIECYVVAEGSFAEQSESVLVEDVHLRKRKSDYGKLKAPSTSAITYWCIEKRKDPRSGDPILWYERCRIKHLLTQRYLAVERRGDRYALTLKEKRPSPEFDNDTTFRLCPVITGEDEIKFEIYARITHVYTRTWLHAMKGKEYERKSVKANASGLDALTWDSAELYELSASTVMAYDDAFTLMQVSDDLVKKFHYVAGVVPILKSYLAERMETTPRQLSYNRAGIMARALNELSTFMLDPYARQKDHQKLVRNLRILEQLVQILKLYNKESPDATALRRVCRGCYKIIEIFLQGDSRKNELYVSRFVPFFEEQMRLELNAEDMLIELVRDNPNIVSRFSHEQIDKIIGHLMDMKEKDCRFLDYLGVACVCEGKAAVSSQEYILDQLVRKHGRDMFFMTEVRPAADSSKKVFYLDQSGSYQPLTAIASKEVVREEKKLSSSFRWLESQLDLFGRLAKGNNEEAIKSITEELKFITFEEALEGANDPDLHPSIRSKYVELITVLFVDVGNNRAVLDNLPNSFVYHEVKENPFADTEDVASKALTGEENPYFDKLREWILKVVGRHTKFDCQESMTGQNMLLAQILGVLELLVKYGYYDDPTDIKDVLKHLIAMLDGSKDVSEAEKAKGGRRADCPANRAVFEIKKKIMKICDLFFNYRFYLRLQRFVYDYRCLKGDSLSDANGQEASPRQQRGGEVSIDIESMAASDAKLHEIEDTDDEAPVATRRGRRGRGVRLPVALLAERRKPPSDLGEMERLGMRVFDDDWLMSLARERLQFIFKATAFFEEGTHEDPRNHEFVKILLDIAGYEDNELVVWSLHLLNRFFTSDTDLFEKAIEAQLLITPQSKATHKLVENQVSQFRKLTLHDLDIKHMKELELLLEQMTMLCLLDKDLEEAHGQNQKILYNHGVLSDVLNLIFRRLDTNSSIHSETSAGSSVADETEEEVKDSLFRKCFQFLVAFAREHRIVQEHLFNRMDSLLAISYAVPEMADVLSEVFSDFQEVCLRVQERQIGEVFRIIVNPKTSASGQAGLLQMLRALTNTKVNDSYLPLKRNQNFIVKHYSKNREFFEVVLGQARQEDRMELLTNAGDNDAQLLVLLNVTDLLASCCEGDNPFIESICQTIFSIDELLGYLVHDDINPDRKRPFCRFLVWVYLSSGSETAAQQDMFSSNNPDLMLFWDQCSEIIYGLTQALKGVPLHNHSSVRRGLRRKKSDTNEPEKGMRKRLKSEIPNVSRVTDGSGNLVRGILPYFMEGILPMLTLYYKQFVSVAKVAEESEKVYTVMGTIASGLMALVEVVTPFLTTSDQMFVLKGTILALMKSSKIEKHLVVSRETVRVCCHFVELKCPEVMSDPAKKYKRQFDKEIQLNAQYNAYVRGYEFANNGPNTIQFQLGVNDSAPFVREPYSEFLDDDMSVKGDEYLPLGRSFQAFVRCFMSHDSSGPKVYPETGHLIRLLDISFNQLEDLTETERVRQDLLDIKCLQVLRAMIQNETLRIDPELKENHPARYRRLAGNIETVQNGIQDLGPGENTIARVVPMLAHPNELTAAEVLAFLSRFLYDGNTTVQAGFEFLTQTREERFFLNIRKRLDHAVAIDRERRALETQLSMKKSDQDYLHECFVERVGTLIRAPRKKSGHDTSLLVPGGQRPSVGVLSPFPEEENDIEMEDFDDDEIDGLIGKQPVHSPPVAKDAGTMKRTTLQLRKKWTGLEGLLAEPPPTSWIHSEVYEQLSQENQGKAASDSKAEELKFQDTNYVELALRVLGLMCDGQNRALQNYLREQPDNINNVNLVGEVSLFLQHFYSDINKENIELVNRILQTLVEMSVGNYYNQQVMFERQIVDIINRILQTSTFPCCAIVDVMELKASAVELIEVMTEETHKETPALAQNVFKALDKDALKNTLVFFFVLKDNPYLESLQKDDDATRAMFRTFHILRHFADFDAISAEAAELIVKPKEKKGSQISEQIEDQWEAWKYCMERSKSVEVLYENLDGEKVLSKVHFTYNPSDELPEELIEKVKWRVNRDSAEDKVRDFLEWTKAVKREVQHVNRIRDHWYTHMFIYKASYQHWGLVLLTLILNIMVLVSWKGPEDAGVLGLATFTYRTQLLQNASARSPGLPTIPLVEIWFGYFALFLLGAVHFGMSLMQVIAYFMVNWPNFYLPSLYYKLRKKKRDGTYSDIPLFGFKTLYYLIFLACSGLSLAFWGYFYCLCLVHIVVNNDILQRVLRSVTLNGKSLLWVAALGFAVLYIYGVIAYAGYQVYYDDPGNSSHCKTLFQCVVSAIRLGLLNGAILTNGDALYEDEGLASQFGLYIPRTIFDITFFVIVTTVGLNIIFGIIVDAFSELRDERYKTEADQKGSCFICNYQAYEFERRAKGFKHHVKHEHNMWDYIYFSLELDRIDSSNQNAIQQYVYDQIEEGDTNFFPILRARCLRDDGDSTKEEIAELKEMIAMIHEKLRADRKHSIKPDAEDEEHVVTRPSTPTPGDS